MNYYRIAQKKYKEAVRIAKILRYVPGIRMIAVCNTLATNTAREESDIDFFIVTAQRRIWTVRFWCVVLLQVLNKRPHPERKKSADKICLSFFVTENSLNLEPYKISVHDPYLTHWIAHIKPLYDYGNVYSNFVRQNQWVHHSEKWYHTAHYKRRVKKMHLSLFLSALVTHLDEELYKKIQKLRMPKGIKSLASSFDSRVIISDSILKFHQNDRRLAFKRGYE